MDLLWLFFWIAVIGVADYLITRYVPMEPIFKAVIHVLAVLAVILVLFKQFSGRVPNVLN